mgnify:CR=1 FL=1|tara:strand:+ start:9477 stop:10139 length:663 start_codon:yes stop_codon:yes gene_type:complete
MFKRLVNYHSFDLVFSSRSAHWVQRARFPSVNNTKLFKTTTAHDESTSQIQPSQAEIKSEWVADSQACFYPKRQHKSHAHVSHPRHTRSLHQQDLRLDGTPLHLLLAVPLALLLQELALLVGAQTTELRVTLLLLQLVCRELALLGLLVLVDFADLGDLLVARLLDAAEGFGAEVRGGGEVVGEADEVVEEGEGGGVVGLELEREVDALLGLGVVEAGMR